jgi:hypothetical protein
MLLVVIWQGHHIDPCYVMYVWVCCYIYVCMLKVLVLQRTAKQFCARLHQLRHQRVCALFIQRVFRGWLCRETYSTLVRVINIRRRQRIANKVVKKVLLRCVTQSYMHISLAIYNEH